MNCCFECSKEINDHESIYFDDQYLVNIDEVWGAICVDCYETLKYQSYPLYVISRKKNALCRIIKNYVFCEEDHLGLKNPIFNEENLLKYTYELALNMKRKKIDQFRGYYETSSEKLTKIGERSLLVSNSKHIQEIFNNLKEISIKYKFPFIVLLMGKKFMIRMIIWVENRYKSLISDIKKYLDQEECIKSP